MKPWKTPDYHIIQSEEAFDKLVKRLRYAIANNIPIAIDIETTGVFDTSGLDIYHDWILGISFAFSKDVGFYIPLAHTENKVLVPNQLPFELVKERLNEVLSSGGLYVGHNIKFDYKFLYNSGITLHPRLWCTHLAVTIIQGDAWKDTGLKKIIGRYVSVPSNEVQSFQEASGGLAAEQDIKEFGQYAIKDTIFTLYLYEEFKPIIDKDFYKLFYDCEMKLTPILAQMELRGIEIDAEYYKKLRKPVERNLAAIGEYFLNKYDINIGSPKQLSEYMVKNFPYIDLKRNKKTNNISVDVESLHDIIRNNSDKPELVKFATRILKYRGLDKILSTYVDKYPNVSEVHYKNGVPFQHILHTDYRQIINSGRLSSSPNIQNIPRNAVIDVRRGFKARKGHVLVIADWAGQELRIVTVASKEPLMMNAYKKDPINADLHRLTASVLFDRPFDEITSEERHVGKTINFSLLYGATEFSIAKTLNCTKPEARDLVDKYYAMYSGIKDWKTKTEQKIRGDRYASTFFGRRRYLPDGVTPNMNERWLYDAQVRALINHIIQGTGADLLKFALVSITHQFAQKGIDAYPLANTHDEIIVETTEPEIVSDIMKKTMEVTIEGIYFPVDLQIRSTFSKKDVVK